FHGQRDDVRAGCGQFFQRSDVLKRRYVLLKEYPMGFEERVLAVVDARSVQANCLDVAFSHEPARGIRMQSWEVQFRNGICSALLRAEILFRVRPVSGETGIEQ